MEEKKGEKKEEILIIGAGPAGMACAMELTKAGKTCTVIEKEEQVGGLAKTLIFKEETKEELTFRTDIGPHRFFSKNPYLYNFIESLLHEKWLVVKRQTRQWIGGKFYDYPIKPLQAFMNIGPIKATKIVIDYLKAVYKYRILKHPIITFEDYIVEKFGRTLAEFNMLNYTEKIWGIPSNEIHPDWAKQRIKGLNLTSALKNALFGKSGPKSLVDEFYYPQFGTGLIYKTIADEIAKKGSKVFTKSYPTKITHTNNKITSVELNINRKKKTITPTKIVESIPINTFLELLSPKPPSKIIEAAQQLRWRCQVYLFITFNKEKITDDNWIYFPDKEIPFGRISEMKNFSKEMAPKGKTSLLIEFFTFENDHIWNATEGEIFNLAMQHLEKIKFVAKEDVRTYKIFRKKNVYPVYDMNYKEPLQKIKDYLNTFKNLHFIGRPGRFKYTNQDHSLEMGIAAAKNIIKNKKIDIESIGAESEYFEKGSVKNN
jgi:protoporphyrinogen oxidase